MGIIDFSTRKIVKLLGTKYRRTDNTSHMLTKIHEDIGKYMGYQILNEFELEEIEIPHPLGTKIGFDIKHHSDVIIISLLRAGLYFSLGIRSVFEESKLFLVNPKRDIGLKGDDEQVLSEINSSSVVIILDSVINTGCTIFPIINQVKIKKPKKVIISTIVIPKKTKDIIDELFPDESFYIFRSSEDMYRASGANDTGNRLYGTYERD